MPGCTPDSALPAEAPAARACEGAGPNPATARPGLGPGPATASERGEGKAEGERKRKADVPMAPRSPAAAAALAAGASGAKRRSSPVPEARLLLKCTHSRCRLDPQLSFLVVKLSLWLKRVCCSMPLAVAVLLRLRAVVLWSCFAG